MKEKTMFLRETIDLVRQIETRFLELGARLYRIKEKQLWLGMYDNYQEFLDSAHISPGNASILASIHKHYVLDGKVPLKTLASIGYSNLYEAIPMIEKKGVERAVVIADTLTRNEIKEAVREQKHGVHDHKIGKDRWGSCENCGKFIKLPL